MNATVFGMACALIPCIVAPAYGWGGEGHEVIGLIADHYLEPAVRAKVRCMPATIMTGAAI